MATKATKQREKKKPPKIVTVTLTTEASLEVISPEDLPSVVKSYAEIFEEWRDAGKEILIWIPVSKIPTTARIDLSFAERPADTITDMDSGQARGRLYHAGRRKSWPKERMIFHPLRKSTSYPEFAELYINSKLEWCYLVGLLKEK